MEIFTNISLSCLEDLSKYGKLFKEENVKINKSKIARNLNVDRRTVTKYLNGYSKPTTRCKKTKLDEYDALITHLISSTTQKFYYVSKGVKTKTWTKLESTSKHKLKKIEEALNLLDQYNGQLFKIVSVLRINRYTLRSWRDKRRKGEPLLL